MAQTTSLATYSKICPDCIGKPFRKGEVKTYFFGLLATRPLICCALCKGAGNIIPKEVILSPSRLKPVSITF